MQEGEEKRRKFCALLHRAGVTEGKRIGESSGTATKDNWRCGSRFSSCQTNG